MYLVCNLPDSVVPTQRMVCGYLTSKHRDKKMKKKFIFHWVFSFSLLLVSIQAQSAILYQVDNRFTSHTLTFAGTETPSSSFADFNSSNWAYEAGAFQNSQLGASSMSGSGYTYAGFDAMNYGAEATSVFDVTFGVDQTSDLALNGFLDINWSDVSVNFIENGVSLFSMSSLDVYGVNPFSFNGQLIEGNTYQLILSSYSFDSDYYNETWNFDMQIAPVPLPAAAWLFIAGMASLMGFAHKRKRN